MLRKLYREASSPTENEKSPVEEFIQQNLTYITGVAKKICSDNHFGISYEDIMQDTCIRILKSSQEITRLNDVNKWLNRLVTNSFYDQVKLLGHGFRNFHTAVALDEPKDYLSGKEALQIPNTAPNAEAVLIAESESQAFFEQLTDKQKEIYKLDTRSS